MSTKNIAAIILIIGLSALIFLNTNPMTNNRFQASSDQSELTSRLKDQPRENLPTQSEKLTELQTEVIMEGNTEDPREVKAGDKITVNYTGWLASSGTIFDSSFNEGRQPFSFTVGSGVIEGWSQGVVGMKLGEVRRLKIPSSLAYAEVGQGSIGPNEDLFFDVELLEIN